MCLAIGITWHFRALRTFFVTCLSSISNPKHLPLARSRPGSVKHLETNPCFLMTLVSCEGLELAVLDVWSLGSVRRLTDKRSQDPSLGSSEIITLSLLDAMLSQARPRDADAHSIPSPRIVVYSDAFIFGAACCAWGGKHGGTASGRHMRCTRRRDFKLVG